VAPGRSSPGRVILDMKKLFSVYLFLVWATLLLGLVAFLARGWRALHNPFQLDYGEGGVIWQAQHVTNLKLAYRSINQFPHLGFNYPPLYHLASRLLDLATGDLLIAGRLISILSTLGISFFSGLIVWSVLPPRMPVSVRATGAALGATLCYSIYTLVWAVYMRVDMLALFFEFAGIYLYLQGRRWQVLEYAAFFCFFLALYTKPTMIAGLIACAVVAVLIAPRKAFKQTGFLITCSAVTFAALVLATHGQFYRNIFLYNRNPFSYALLSSILKRNIAGVGPITAVALALPFAFLAGLLARTGGRLDRFRAAMLHSPFHRATAVGGLFLIVAILISFAAARTGATFNYMLEWNLAACPLAALLFSDVLYWWQRQRRLPPVYAAILLLPVIHTLGEVGITSFTHEDWDIARSQRDAAAVLERIRQVEQPVYSTDMVLLYRAGKPPAAEPAMVSVLAEQGQWDDSPFANRIESGYFGLIVSRYPLSERWMYSPRVETAIWRAYEPSETIGDYRLYRPRDPLPASTSAK
jgi:hypothetical protein